jgi:hypothetical protein
VPVCFLIHISGDTVPLRLQYDPLSLDGGPVTFLPGHNASFDHVISDR